MAEIVSSAVVQETVSKVLSNLVQKYEETNESNKDRNLERLEMAHIRLEAVLETSDKWQITDASLLRWRSKLKRVAQECNDTLHSSKQRILEDEETEKEVRKSSFPKRIAHTTRSFVSSIFGPNKDESNSSIARRFEWFADGASEFLKLVELGGTPRRHMAFHPLNRHLLAGKTLQHRIIQTNKRPLVLLLAPFIAEHGTEARIAFVQKGGNVPEDNFSLTLMLQLSESTDIVGIAIKCLQLLAPLFKSTVETIRRELMKLPTEHLSWVPHADRPGGIEHWDTIHSLSSQWFRPDPLCCKQHHEHKLRHGRKLNNSRLLDISLEPVIEIHLQGHVSLSECNKHKALMSEFKNSHQDSPYLKAGILFTPHGHSEDILLADRSLAIATILSEEKNCLDADFTLGQLEEIVLTKAIHHFYKNGDATVYQILWRSKHGTAYIHVEKAGIVVPSTKGTMQRTYEELGSGVISSFNKMWVTHAPTRLQGLIKEWLSVCSKHVLSV